MVGSYYIIIFLIGKSYYIMLRANEGPIKKNQEDPTLESVLSYGIMDRRLLATARPEYYVSRGITGD